MPDDQTAGDDMLKRLDALAATYRVDDAASRAKHQEQLAEMDRLKASLQQTQASLDKTEAALDPAKLKTTVTQVRRWAEVETHPNWFWAAYADLAQRLTRVETSLEELDASISLLHTKMETIIGQLAIHERLDRGEQP